MVDGVYEFVVRSGLIPIRSHDLLEVHRLAEGFQHAADLVCSRGVWVNTRTFKHPLQILLHNLAK